ncbi:hypothetical protein ACNF42_05725 [Cuniculiplasma sp. SKW3]
MISPDMEFICVVKRNISIGSADFSVWGYYQPDMDSIERSPSIHP